MEAKLRELKVDVVMATEAASTHVEAARARTQEAAMKIREQESLVEAMPETTAEEHTAKKAAVRELEELLRCREVESGGNF